MKKVILILAFSLAVLTSYGQYVIADGGNTITYSDGSTLLTTMDKQALTFRSGGGDVFWLLELPRCLP